jgi:hypothetical protein
MTSEEKKTDESQKAEDEILGAPDGAQDEMDEQVQALSSGFSRFAASLHMACLYHLGLVPGPGGEKPQPNLELARENIDILEMLQEKTKGNLDVHEERVLRGVLSEVRMAFLDVANRGEKPD